MITFALQSGSNGNSIYVETADARLLFDAGISGRRVRERLGRHGRDIESLDALILSHNHRDHVSGAGVLQRRFGLPLYVTRRSWQACAAELGPCQDIRHFTAGQTLRFGETRIHTVPTAHDGHDGVAFVVVEKNRHLGIFTDLGCRFAGLDAWIAELDGLYLESNYDPDLLADGPYPAWLQRRIRGSGGHLSNREAAELVRDANRGRLQFWILSHLSENNNHPDLALQTARSVCGSSVPLALASRQEATKQFTVD
ncbi:MAG: MBL fold metallo-hydrolase [Sedimentisphaerales bacterium]|nr:MBL fold metallo-hydrolase [Sedimentisphaerales bacterium]